MAKSQTVNCVIHKLKMKRKETGEKESQAKI